MANYKYGPRPNRRRRVSIDALNLDPAINARSRPDVSSMFDQIMNMGRINSPIPVVTTKNDEYLILAGNRRMLAGQSLLEN